MKNGQPWGGAMVLLFPENSLQNESRFRRDQSDSDGTFTLYSIAPEKYSVLAIENGWDLEWSNPAILKTYMPQAQKLLVGPEGKYQLKVKVQ